MILSLIVSAAAVTQPGAIAQPPAHCPKTVSYHALNRGKAPAPRKLTELPPANGYAAVYRKVNGCEAPVVVRYNVRGRR